MNARQGIFLMGCGAGFSGDRVDAPISVVDSIVDSGLPGAIMFETLAERTLALGQVARRADPARGYEPLLAEFIKPILAKCIAHNIPIVGNFGAANPQGAAALLRQLANEAGLPDVRIAVVSGDDIQETIALDELEVWEGDAGLRGDTAAGIIAANVYLGARPIAEALLQGAQIVVTGRVADPALALGPLAAHFGWDWEDWDKLAAGTLVGHLLECGAQATGGYFADPGYKEVPHPEAIGFPIAEVSSDGSCVITKADGTGGIVNLQTVTEQILYEIHDPSAYLTPDVTLDVTGVTLNRVGADRVLVAGARGRSRPSTLKATVSFPGDWLGEGEISYAGPNALARARLAADIIRKRLVIRGLPVRSRIDLIGALSVFDSDAGHLAAAADFEAPEIRVRLAVSGSERQPVDQSVQEMVSLFTCGPAAGGGVRTRTQNRIRTVSYLVPRNRVMPHIEFYP
jgi:hypothetical protein